MDDYKAAGVNIAAGAEAVARMATSLAATRDENVIGSATGFAAVYRLPPVPEPVLVSATDGVGTKLLLALQEDQHDTIGIDLVAMVANDLLAQGARPLFFLDYLATDVVVPERVATIVAGIAAGCQQAGMALIGGETAEMPGMYPADHYDLAGFAVGIASASKLLPQGVAAGDVLLGLPSSGVHSNGYSLVRKLLAETSLAAAPLADGTPMLAALLAPTRIYVQAVTPLIAAGLVHGIAHITGGGFTENLPRILPAELAARLRPWPLPELFQRLQAAGNLSLATMRRTFNLGFGLVLAVAPGAVAAVQAALPEAQVIGRVEPRTGQAVEWEAEG